MSQQKRDAVYVNAKETHTATLIFLHGLGDSGRGWSPNASAFQKNAPYMKCVFPNAPISPVTLNRGMKMPSWHDIHSLRSISKGSLTGRDESQAIIEAFIEDEIKAGIPAGRILLGGFSQGAAMSCWTGMQYKKKLAGVVCLSGYIPYGEDFTKLIKNENKGTPVLVCHGTSDQTVAPLAGKHLYETLKSASIPAEMITYDGMGHSSSYQEMNDVGAFIAKCLPKK